MSSITYEYVNSLRTGRSEAASEQTHIINGLGSEAIAPSESHITQRTMHADPYLEPPAQPTTTYEKCKKLITNNGYNKQNKTLEFLGPEDPPTFLFSFPSDVQLLTQHDNTS